MHCKFIQKYNLNEMSNWCFKDWFSSLKEKFDVTDNLSFGDKTLIRFMFILIISDFVSEQLNIHNILWR